MSTYTIEDGIPLPTCPSRGNGGGPRCTRTPWTSTLDAMRPGQSALTTEHTDVKATEQFRLRRPERTYAVRKVPGQGWRVWRTE